MIPLWRKTDICARFRIIVGDPLGAYIGKRRWRKILGKSCAGIIGIIRVKNGFGGALLCRQTCRNRPDRHYGDGCSRGNGNQDTARGDYACSSQSRVCFTCRSRNSGYPCLGTLVGNHACRFGNRRSLTLNRRAKGNGCLFESGYRGTRSVFCVHFTYCGVRKNTILTNERQQFVCFVFLSDRRCADHHYNHNTSSRNNISYAYKQCTQYVALYGAVLGKRR